MNEDKLNNKLLYSLAQCGGGLTKVDFTLQYLDLNFHWWGNIRVFPEIHKIYHYLQIKVMQSRNIGNNHIMWESVIIDII